MSAVSALLAEVERRDVLWRALLAQVDPDAIAPQVISDIGLRPHKTVQGIFRDKEHTEAVAPPHGITFSLLFTGKTYDDTFDESGAIYHYPSTQRAGRDHAEIEATKNASRGRLPVFIIMGGPTPYLRRVRRAWIEDWDDASRLFLISFVADLGKSAGTAVHEEFVLWDERRTSALSLRTTRPGQTRFRFMVFKRYGPKCAVCNVATSILLEAVHLCAFARGGTDDARNGLVLCRNHHRAFDKRLFSFEPGSSRIVCRRQGPMRGELGIAFDSLDHLCAAPHVDALAWCWEQFRVAEGFSDAE